MHKEFKKSVVSGADLEPIFSLGPIYVSDFLRPDEEPKGDPVDLELAFDPISKVAQLTKQPDGSLMWGSMYFYRSRTNPIMVNALKNVAESLVGSIKYDKSEKQVYVDCAGNDSTLLSFLDKDKFIRVNIDPSEYPEAKENCDIFIQDYFSKESFYKTGYKKCKFFSANAVFYDLSDPNNFLQNLYEILEDDGVALLQMSYTPLMILQNEFGNLVHEHLCYYNLTSLKYLFDRNGFTIRDVELNTVNGGSIRVFIQKNISPNNFKDISYRDVAKIRINSILEWEENNGYNSKQVYIDFYDRIIELKNRIVSFIKEARNKGESVWAYGASTKGNTLLQFFLLDDTLIDGIAEKQDFKWGLKTVGTNIPIYSEEEFRKVSPDYTLILPWFFIEEFTKREYNYLDNGGVFIIPCPNLYLHGKLSTEESSILE